MNTYFMTHISVYLTFQYIANEYTQLLRTQVLLYLTKISMTLDFMILGFELFIK